MRIKCPNESCPNHNNPSEKFYRKNGYFTNKSSGDKIQKYKCKNCKKDFSFNTFSPTYKQSKVHLNQDIVDLLFDQYSEQEIANRLEITKKTVESKLHFLGNQAKKLHEEELFNIPEEVVVESFQTYEHSKDNIIYVDFIINPTTNKIIKLNISRLLLDMSKYQIVESKYGYAYQVQRQLLRLNPETTNGPKSKKVLELLLYLYINRINNL